MKRFKLTEKQLGVLLVLIVISVLLIQFYNEKNNERLLKNNKQTIAFIIRILKGNPKSPKSALLFYNVGGMKYEFRQTGNYDAYKIGDTVLIEYAVKDHSVARVVDKYYMQKYKHLKEKKEN